MTDKRTLLNPYSEDKVLSACSIFGMMDTSGKPFYGGQIFAAMENMHDRGNGLGGGFAIYGLYPDFPDSYALHIMLDSEQARQDVEEFVQRRFDIALSELVPTRKTEGITGEPEVRRYFCNSRAERLAGSDEGDYVAAQVFHINNDIDGAFVFSSGKNMGVFKGVGFPEQIARYFRLEEYSGYIWTAHGRFPTNSQAWWGGAHPFSLLNYSVVHNGELSSYGANRAFLETLGYKCTMFTDTEVLAYAVDMLMRRREMSAEVFAKVIAPPLWDDIDMMTMEDKSLYTALRVTYGGLLMNGPFAIVVADQKTMVAITDRIRLRPLTAATKDELVFFSSEEAAIRLVCPDLDQVWSPMGGEPVVSCLGSLPKPEESAKRRYNYAQAGGVG